MESETSWTAVIALVLSVLAIIFIIVLIYLFSVNSNSLIGRIDDWTLRESGTSGTLPTPEGFVATPNTILNVASNIPAGYYVQIQPYSGINSIVTNGRTTIFKISNTRAAQPVNVAFGTGITPVMNNGNVPNPALVAPSTTATYMWVSPTLIQRIE